MAFKIILKYKQGSQKYGIIFSSSSLASKQDTNVLLYSLNLTAYARNSRLSLIFYLFSFVYKYLLYFSFL